MAALAAACSRGEDVLPVVIAAPETAVAYEVALVGSPSDDITDLMELSLAVYRFQDKGAASLAFLRRRAEGDAPTLIKILRSRGYYAATVDVLAEETAEGEARVTFAIAPGPYFTLARHDLIVMHDGVAPPPLDAAALGSPIGQQAMAAKIAGAEAEAVAALRRQGFPYARYVERGGLADPQTASLEVESVIASGPAATFGDVRFEGLETVDEDYLRSYLPWKPGEVFDTAALTEYQRRLFATDLFRAASVRMPETPPAAKAAPAPLQVIVSVDEGPRRRIAGSLRYETDLGPSVRASFEHRNLFGSNERLLLQAEGGLVEQSVGIGLTKPQYLRHGQKLLIDVTGRHTEDDAFDALTLTGFTGLERQVSKEWRGGLGALAEYSYIEDGGMGAGAYLFGAPFFATYDGSNNLLDPTDGVRFRFEATPFVGFFDKTDTEFLVLDAEGAIYQPLDAEKKYVFAARARAASILAGDLDDIPATRRLYSGGGGSVRGYAEKFIGPLDAANDPVGGRSALEVGVEMRARVYGDFGGVAFLEAGTVSTEMFPSFEENIQAAAGLGFRYYSSAGPIRLDVAVPVNPRSVDDPFQLYFSIGQAF